jgi:hypothetical protein
MFQAMGSHRPLCADPNYAHTPRESQQQPLLRPALLRIIVTASAGNA